MAWHISSIPDDILEFEIISRYLNHARDFTRVILTCSSFWNRGEWKMKKCLDISDLVITEPASPQEQDQDILSSVTVWWARYNANRQRHIIKCAISNPQSLWHLASLLPNLERIESPDSWLLDRDWAVKEPILAKLTHLTILPTFQRSWLTIRKAELVKLPKLKSLTLVHHCYDFETIRRALLESSAAQLEELSVHVSNLSQILAVPNIMTNLKRLEIQISSADVFASNCLPPYKPGCVINLTRFVDMFRRSPAPLPLGQKLFSDEEALEELKRERLYIQGAPFASWFLSNGDLSNFSAAQLVHFYKRGRSLGMKKVINAYVTIQHCLDCRPAPDPADTETEAAIKWLRYEEFETLKSQFVHLDMEGKNLSSFCLGFFRAPPLDGNCVRLLQEFADFVREHSGSLYDCVSYLSKRCRHSYVTVILQALQQGGIADALLEDLLRALSLRDLFQLGDEGRLKLLGYPCGVTLISNRFAEDYPGQWARSISWPEVKHVLSMTHCLRSHGLPVVLEPQESWFLRTNREKSFYTGALYPPEIVVELLADQNLLNEYARVFIDAPRLISKPFVDIHYEALFESVTDYTDLFLPWIIFAENCRVFENNSDNLMHLCDPRRLASIICRTVLSHHTPRLREIVTATVFSLPEVLREWRTFIRGGSTLYFEDTSQGNGSISQVQKEVSLALAECGIDTHDVAGGLEFELPPFDRSPEDNDEDEEPEDAQS